MENAALFLALLSMTQAPLPPSDPALVAGSDAPAAPREPRDVSVHGETRIDDWYWLRDREDPRTTA